MRRTTSTQELNTESTFDKLIEDNESKAKQQQEIRKKKEVDGKDKRHVTFASEVQFKTIERFEDPEIKRALYYTREDIWIFHKRLEIALALQRQLQTSQALQLKMKENRFYLEFQNKKIIEKAKRAMVQAAPASGSEVSAKRQRL